MPSNSITQPPGCVTELLNSGDFGDRWNQVAPLVYDELKRLARAYMRKERSGHVLQPTALVHETYVRLLRQERTQWASRVQFYGVAGLLMRRILVDHARRRRSEQGALTVTAMDRPESGGTTLNILVLDEALDRLAQIDLRQCRVVELRYFAGMSTDEVAEVLSVSTKTVKRDWAVARAWLYQELDKARQ